MSSVAYTAEYYRIRGRSRDRRIVLAVLAVSALLAGFVLAAPPGWLALVLALGIALCVATWYRPAAGIAALLGSALLIEQFDFADNFKPITRAVPLFQSLSGITHVGSLSVSPFEVALVVVAAIVLTRGVVKRVRWEGSTVFALVAPFMAVLLFWFGYGVICGGSVQIAVWELRAFVYFAAFVFLGSYAMRDERDVRLVLSTAGVVVAAKAVQAVWEWYVILNGHLSGIEAVTGHEDALFMAVIVVLFASALAYKSMPRLSVVLAAMLPVIGCAFIATDRRAAYVALALGLAAFSALLLTDPAKRRLVGRVAIPAALAAVIVIAAGWNGTGPFSRPARAVRSMVEPQTTQDAESNYYRKAEETMLIMAIHRSPILGLGFGRPFMSGGQLSKIGFEFADYIAHNQIMWLWAKLGTLGFAVFWIMAGGLIAYGGVVFRSSSTPLARTVAATATCAVIMQLIVSYVDMQLTFARNMVFLGVLVALLAAVARLERGGAVAPR